MPTASPKKKRQAQALAASAIPKQRPARKPLSRDAILKASLALVDDHGADALSMRQLGRALGVEAMSLYYYFKNRDELLDGAVEAVMREVLDAVDGQHRKKQNWRTIAKNYIAAYRMVGQRHANRIRLVAQRPLRTAAAREIGKVLADAFLQSGLKHDDAMIAYRAITCFAAGFALLEHSGMRPAYTMGDYDAEFSGSVDIIISGIENRLAKISPAYRRRG